MNICIEDNDGDVLYLTNDNVKAIKRVEVTDTDVSFEIQFNDGTSTYITFYFENYTEKQKTGRFITKNMYINDIRVGNKEDDENERTDVIWYQPEGEGLYPSKHGRALQYGMTEHGWEDWCDIEIKKIRSKWESVACPELVNNKLYLKARI